MATGRSMQLTKQVGEYLVCAELCRRGLISTTFTGNVPGFDILATKENLQTTPIQVKTISGPSWQFDATKFLDIEISDNIQTVRGKTEVNPGLIYLLVSLKGQNTDEFYICKVKDLQNMMHQKYTAMLARKEGKRPKNPKTTHFALSPNDLKKHKDKWEIITKGTA
ncbi:MAG: hypothetical protein HY673_26295 [Chloroflexi bacterium]|nr:hypothetical protein [Chloroflexota bacterium]